MIYYHLFDDEKEIEKISFFYDLKENVDNLTVSIISGSFEHAPIIIKDPSGAIRGLMSLKTRKPVRFIGENINSTSNGMISGKIQKGRWEIQIIKPSTRVTGKFQIEVSKNMVYQNKDDDLVDILSQDWNKKYSEESKWYMSEFHCHSYYSDGRVNFEEIEKSFKENQFDTLAIMDHSVVTTQFPKIESPILPGTELTLDNEVHYNAFGIKELVDYSKYFDNSENKNDSLNKMFTDLADKEVLLSLNHLFANGMTLKHDFDIRNFTLMEVINAPWSIVDNVDNAKSIRFFDFLWANGHRLFGIGGSDAHSKNYNDGYPIGIPQVKVHCNGLSIKNILYAIKNGNIIIGDRINYEVNYLDENNQYILPGSEYDGIAKFVGSSDKVVQWIVKDNGAVIASKLGMECDFPVDILPGHYVRLEAWTDEIPVIFANPLTNQYTVKKSVNSFQQLLSEFSETQND